jgi:hypothetical protein
LANSQIFDNGTNVGIGKTVPTAFLDINGTMFVSGSLSVSGSFNATVKSFLISHPTKLGMKLEHGVVEGPEHSVFVRGRTRFPYICLPDYWAGLVHVESITVQLTPIGMAQSLFVKEVDCYKIAIENKCDPYIDCYYFIQGERKDIPKLEVEF